jgi:hypothetical protein
LFENGQFQAEERNHQAKLTDEKVREIFRLAKEGFTSKQVAKIYDKDSVTVNCILRGASWKHIYAEMTSNKRVVPPGSYFSYAMLEYYPKSSIILPDKLISGDLWV